jgi:hypothetical protein
MPTSAAGDGLGDGVVGGGADAESTGDAVGPSGDPDGPTGVGAVEPADPHAAIRMMTQESRDATGRCIMMVTAGNERQVMLTGRRQAGQRWTSRIRRPDVPPMQQAAPLGQRVSGERKADMASIWADRVEGWIAWVHGEVERAVREAAPDLRGVRPATTAPSIAFQGWHIARWADIHTPAVARWLDPTASDREVWTERKLIEAWGLDGLDVGGYGGTGEGLSDDASAALPLPTDDRLLDYLDAAFRGLERVVGRIRDDAILERSVVDLYGDEGPIGEVLLNHLSHADRHLGMIEALRGVVGERGTATV